MLGPVFQRATMAEAEEGVTRDAVKQAAMRALRRVMRLSTGLMVAVR